MRLPRPKPTNKREDVQAHRLSGAFAAKRCHDFREERLGHVVTKRQDHRDDKREECGKSDDESHCREGAEHEPDGEQSGRPNGRQPGQ